MSPKLNTETNMSSEPENTTETSPKATGAPSRIAIVGSGQVGGAAAYALILGHVADWLILVDSNIELRDGQVRDLSNVAYTHHSQTRVRAGSYHEAGQCDIIVIAAGCKYTTGEEFRAQRG